LVDFQEFLKSDRRKEIDFDEMLSSSSTKYVNSSQQQEVDDEFDKLLSSSGTKKLSASPDIAGNVEVIF
jgi:hypothetical protein